ncbi:oxidoreductase [Limibaculum sp. M0105]|uniref:Oxidoreductase n=1 Tax=Thermohalobaculum xanthum TaxID=2753746 RepID=A0A8J7M4V2_9RHOB|nr:oxidoreductase [Thermohalobaculum xanthum]
MLAIGFGANAFSEPLRAPEGSVLLTVEGAISNTNADGAARFDRAMLEALPVTEFETTTIWTEAKHRFTGVALGDVLAAVGARGDAIKAVALNDYSITMPLTEAREDGPIVAYLMDGEAMSSRGKGPLWIIFPFDDRPEFRTERSYSLSIWQLARIIVTE